MEYKHFKNDCYNLYTVKTNKFNKIIIEVIFESIATKKNITFLTLLLNILTSSSKKYKTQKLFKRKLENLYNADITYDNYRVGKTIVSKISLEILNINENIINKAIEFIFDIIFNPNIDNNKFNKKIFDIKKEETLHNISISNETIAISYTNNKTKSLNINGYEEILNNIDNTKLYKYYIDFIENTKKSIYILGNIDINKVNKNITKYTKFNSINTYKYKYYTNNKTSKYKKIINNTKENIVLINIYNITNLNSFELNYVLPIYNLIFGSNNLTSKIYKTIRKDNKLSYKQSSDYLKYDKLIILSINIEAKNINKTLKLIKKVKREMKLNITNTELENAKKLIKTSLESINDDANKIIDNYIFKNIVDLKDYKTRINNFNKVSIKDIKSVDKKIKLILTYIGDTI